VREFGLESRLTSSDVTPELLLAYEGAEPKRQRRRAMKNTSHDCCMVQSIFFCDWNGIYIQVTDQYRKLVDLEQSNRRAVYAGQRLIQRINAFRKAVDI